MYAFRIAALGLIATVGCGKSESQSGKEPERQVMPFESPGLGTAAPGSPFGASSGFDRAFGAPSSTVPATVAAGTPIGAATPSPGVGRPVDVPFDVPLSAAELLNQSSAEKSSDTLRRLNAVQSTDVVAEELFKSGFDALEKGDLERSLIYFEKLQVTAPEDIRGYLGAAECHRRRNDLSEALATCAAGLVRQPDDPLIRFVRAKILSVPNSPHQDFSRAYEDLTLILQKQPDNVEVLAMRCSINLMRRKYSNLGDDADALMRLLPRSPEGYFFKAVFFGTSDRMAEGRKMFLEAERLGLPQATIGWARPFFFPPGSPPG